jgi:hypothetical protein
VRATAADASKWAFLPASETIAADRRCAKHQWQSANDATSPRRLSLNARIRVFVISIGVTVEIGFTSERVYNSTWERHHVDIISCHANAATRPTA